MGISNLEMRLGRLGPVGINPAAGVIRFVLHFLHVSPNCCKIKRKNHKLHGRQCHGWLRWMNLIGSIPFTHNSIFPISDCHVQFVKCFYAPRWKGSFQLSLNFCNYFKWWLLLENWKVLFSRCNYSNERYW